MQAVDFPESNHELKPPVGYEDEVYALPVHVGSDAGHQVYTSCWRVSPADVERMKQTGVVYLSIWGSSHPPVVIETVPYYEQKKTNGEANVT